MFELETGLIFWNVVSFLVLLVLLYKFVFPPLLKVLDQRRAAIDGRIKQAKQAQAEAEGLLKKYHEKLTEVERKTTAMFEEAERQTKAYREEALSNAQREARVIIERTRDEIEVVKNKSLQGLKEDIAAIVVDVNRRLIKKELDQQDHLRLIEASIMELESVKRKV